MGKKFYVKSVVTVEHNISRKMAGERSVRDTVMIISHRLDIWKRILLASIMEMKKSKKIKESAVKSS